MKNIKIILLIVVLTVSKLSYSQLSLSDRNFLGNHHSTKDYNPAFIPNHNFHFNSTVIPVFMDLKGGAYLAINYNDIVTKTGGKTYMDLGKFGDKVSNDGSIRFMTDIQIKILDFGWRYKKSYYNIGINSKIHTFLNIDGGLIEVIPFVGSGFDGSGRSYSIENTKMYGVGYGELFLGYSRVWNKNLTLGARMKFLYGTGASANLNNITLKQNANDYAISGTLGYELKIPGVGEASETDLLYSITGTGFAIDLGGKYEMDVLDRKLTLGASLIDLGFIRIPKAIDVKNVGGKFEYKGNEIDDLSNINPSDSEKIIDDLEGDSDTTTGYNFWLATTLNLSADWEFIKNNHVGINYLQRFYGSSWVVAANIYYSIHNKWVGISPSLNFYNYSVRPGAMAYVNAFGWKWHIGMDNLLFDITTMKSINVNFGMSLVVGYKNDKERKEKIFGLKDSERIEQLGNPSFKNNNLDDTTPIESTTNEETLTEEQRKKIEEAKESFKENNNL